MVKVGNKELIHSSSFMANDGEAALLSVPIGNDTLRISFTFIEGEGNEREATWSVEEGVVKFKIKGWRNSLGTCISDPVKFADAGNRKVYLQIAQYLIGADNNLCHVFLYLGVPNE